MNRQDSLAGDIDRMSPEPFYLQLSKLVEEAIDTGAFAVGDRLPAESGFCRRFDLARSTVRETLRTLRTRGRIQIVPRRGAFVIDPDRSGWVLQAAASFFEGEVEYSRRRVDTEVLEAKRTLLDGDAAAALGLGPKDEGFLLRRLRRLDGQVALYSINCLLPELEPVVRNSSIMQARGSLNRVLRGAGYVIYGARRSVEAVPAPAAVARLLEVPAGAPLLLVTSVSWGGTSEPSTATRPGCGRTWSRSRWRPTRRPKTAETSPAGAGPQREGNDHERIAAKPAKAGLATLALALLAGAPTAARAAEPVTLTLALAANPQMQTAAKLIDNFYAKYPDIKVRFQILPENQLRPTVPRTSPRIPGSSTP